MSGTKTKILAAAVVVAGAALAAYGWVRAGGAADRHLDVIASGEIRARVRRCGCQGEIALPVQIKFKFGTCACRSVAPPPQVAVDLGALPERSAYQAAVGGDPLVVDAGDLFFPRLDPVDYERPEWQRRAELLVEVMERLKLRTFTPGELDLALGRSTLEGLAKKAKFTFVAANLRDAKTHLPVFATRASIAQTGIQVGVVGIVDPPRTEALSALLAREGLELSDSIEAVKTEVAALRKEGCEILLLVAHAPDPVARAIGKAVPGIDLVVESHSEVRSNAASGFEDGTAYVAPWPGGGVPLRMQLHFVPGATGVTDEEVLIEARSWLERVRAQLADQVREREKATPERARELDVQIAMVEGKIKEREATLPKQLHHELMSTATPLQAVYWKQGHDPAIDEAIARFKNEVDHLGLDPEVARKIEAPGLTAKGRPDAYAGEAACATCHKPQAQNWLMTKHSRAWASLEKSESQKDPECVRCHSIGFRQGGGFAEPHRIEHDGRDYRNVQCESCHGARLSHTDDPRGAGVGVHTPGIETCKRCHDSEHDPTFDEERFRNALDGGMRVCVKGLP